MCISPISRLTTFFGFLGCVQKKEKHILDWARMYIIEFLEVRIRKKPTMNLIVPQRWQSNMLDLHSIDKENSPPEPALDNRRPSF